MCQFGASYGNGRIERAETSLDSELIINVLAPGELPSES
jgi:hypothetical protein